ncbi:hypothetical protein GCM10007854_01730 [Algimonas porphyrae]|uniref:Uncharacterized protein n=1 Tax=Algimonas porphyrae TaxID=1128113 RepID=A0ABQ5UVE0_9PROT|nr:hypothetical protein GCM10007854_01730 [Algimonas porphyrae]
MVDMRNDRDVAEVFDLFGHGAAHNDRTAGCKGAMESICAWPNTPSNRKRSPATLCANPNISSSALSLVIPAKGIRVISPFTAPLIVPGIDCRGLWPSLTQVEVAVSFSTCLAEGAFTVSPCGAPPDEAPAMNAGDGGFDGSE